MRKHFRYHYETTWESEDSAGNVIGSIECRIIYHVHSFGAAEYIPPYNRPDLYDPGSGAEIEIVDVLVESFDKHVLAGMAGIDGKWVKIEDLYPVQRESEVMRETLMEWAEGLEEALLEEARKVEASREEASKEHAAEVRAELARERE